MEHLLPQILNQQDCFAFSLLFVFFSPSLRYLSSLVSDYFDFPLCICQCFGHRLLYYCQKALAAFLQVPKKKKTNQPPLALNKVIVKYCTNTNVYSALFPSGKIKNVTTLTCK